MKIRNLERNDVEELVASTFGDVPHRPRLVQWLYSVDQGNPAQSLELLTTRYSQGRRYYRGRNHSIAKRR